MRSRETVAHLRWYWALPCCSTVHRFCRKMSFCPKWPTLIFGRVLLRWKDDLYDYSFSNGKTNNPMCDTQMTRLSISFKVFLLSIHIVQRTNRKRGSSIPETDISLLFVQHSPEMFWPRLANQAHSTPVQLAGSAIETECNVSIIAIQFSILVSHIGSIQKNPGSHLTLPACVSCLSQPVLLHPSLVDTSTDVTIYVVNNNSLVPQNIEKQSRATNSARRMSKKQARSFFLGFSSMATFHLVDREAHTQEFEGDPSRSSEIKHSRGISNSSHISLPWISVDMQIVV